MTTSDPSGAERTRAGRRGALDVDGIILLDKPIGLTSNQALQRVKRLCRARKAGHTGSLDPLATGMLPICLGQATKVSAYLLGADKVYRFRIRFGIGTATGDGAGETVATGPENVSRSDLEGVLERFRGAILQVPPMYSALKVGGRRLYELARAGQELPLAPRPVEVHELCIESYDPVEPVLRIRCGKGTYIRSLAADIARAAGTVGHVAELRRLSVGSFPESSMRGIEEIEAGVNGLDGFLLSPDAALGALTAVCLTVPEMLKISRGQFISHAAGPPCGPVRLYDDAGRFVGVGEQLVDGRIQPRRLLTLRETA